MEFILQEYLYYSRRDFGCMFHTETFNGFVLRCVDAKDSYELNDGY
jgi:hypothetical protein